MNNHTIGEPTEMPTVRRRGYWQVLFEKALDRLMNSHGLAIPVQFEDEREAHACKACLRYAQRRDANRPDYFSLIRSAKRRKTVFFWLDKEAPDAPTT